jgi:DNA-binding response OmpR family regulator
MKTVLVVDDDQIQHLLLKKYLSARFNVLEALNGAQGLEVASEKLPDIIIADVNMPGLNGFELCEALLKCDALKHIPILLMSAKDNIDELLKVYDLGGHGFLTKPIYHPELIKQIDYVLNQASLRKDIADRLGLATETAFTAMSSMSEIGQLMHAVTKLNFINNESDLIEHILSVLSGFSLLGVVEIYDDNMNFAGSSSGEVTPLERAILQKMRTMDRVFQYQRMLSINYKNVCALITNIPFKDDDKAGRLRDYLAILLEAAQNRIENYQLRLNLNTKENLIFKVKELVETLNALQNQQELGGQESRSVMSSSLMQLEDVLTKFALSDSQEEELLRVVRKSWDYLYSRYDIDHSLNMKLSKIARELNELI